MRCCFWGWNFIGEIYISDYLFQWSWIQKSVIYCHIGLLFIVFLFRVISLLIIDLQLILGNWFDFWSWLVVIWWLIICHNFSVVMFTKIRSYSLIFLIIFLHHIVDLVNFPSIFPAHWQSFPPRQQPSRYQFSQ
jgi:hypothetical protein